MDLATIQISDFEPLVNQIFRADLAGQIFDLTLFEVSAARHRRNKPGIRAPFFLLFTGPPDIDFSQGIFPLTHEAVGTLEIFLVPIDREEDGRLVLQAVFN